MRRQVNSKIKENKSSGEYLNDFQAIVNQLTIKYYKVDDEAQNTMLSRETHAIALNNSDSDELVLMCSVVRSLLNEEIKKMSLMGGNIEKNM